MKNSGFSLVETLIVMMTLPAILLVVGGIFRLFAQDMPQGARLVEANHTLLDFLNTLQRDMDTAQGFSLDSEPNHPLLSIQTEHQAWRYQCKGDIVERVNSNMPEQKRTWPLPRGVIHWQQMYPYPESAALVIKTGFRSAPHGPESLRLANTRLLFPGRAKTV
ncbi:hypothetical protein ACFL6U_29710, partial [Planctomycetota bacterium]